MPSSIATPQGDGRERFRFWIVALLLFVLVQTLGRAVLVAWSLWTESRFGIAMVGSLLYGVVADAATALALGAPFLFGLYAIGPMWRRAVMRWGAHALLIVMLLILVFTAFAEIFFWNEFDSRFNSIAVNYVIFPREVIGNVRESFNLGVFLPIVGVLVGLFYLLLRRRYDRALRMAPVSRGQRWRMVGLAGTGFVTGIAILTLLPLDLFGDRAINEISKNGFYSLMHAGLTNDAEFDGLYPTIPDEEASRLARRLVAQDNTRFIQPDGDLSLMRHVDNGAQPKRLNVVLVLEESFGSLYMNGLDNPGPESISPQLTALAKDGLLFTNIYATGNRTVRGLEALLTSFPPIPGISTTRRAGSEGMNSLPFLLKRAGYKTAFLYGGRAAFDNMGHYWSTIGFDRVLQQSDIREIGFSTIWGAADEYLFTEAIKRLDEMTTDKAPVFLSLLTVSNHRPYTYPAGRIDKNPKQKRKENSATYADWAFGDFIERARKRPWFADTVFIFIGDHGPRVYGAAQVPVPSYRVPLLFYSPANIPARRDPTLGSSLDVTPTLLGLLGLSYDSPFFGVDLRRVPPGGGRVAMEHNFSVALGDGKNVAMLLPGRQLRGWSMTPGPNALTPQPDVDAELLRQTIALYQTAHRLFYARQYHELGPNPTVAQGR